MEREATFSTLLMVLREPLMAVNERGVIVSSNEAATQMLARRDRALEGLPVSAFLWGDDDAALDDLLRRGARTRAMAELCFGYPGGVLGSADVTVWPLREGRGEGVGVGVPGEELIAVLVHDLSSSRRDSERLAYQAAELEVRRAELGSQADEASRHAQELKTALETRHRFYASMSHELRTPVNAILGYSELLLDGIYGELAPAQSKILRRSQRAASHLQELLNDLLDLARIEEGRLELKTEPVDVVELVEGLFDSVRPLAQQHSVELRHEAEPGMPPLTSDPRRIRKILLHLLTNAIKYAGQGPVTIRSGSARVGDGAECDGVFIEVTDRGAGMAPEELSRIFSEFVRRRNDTEGTGLGLSIARGLSEALGGTLVAESTPGRGSTFRLTLPYCSGSDGDETHALPLARRTRQ